MGKRNGMFRNARPDDMLAHAIRAVVAQAPGVDPARIGDVIVGCAIPEAEQGLNVARIGALLAGLPEDSIEAAREAAQRDERDGWKFTCGRAEGCSTLFFNNRAEFDYACAKATGTQP